MVNTHLSFGEFKKNHPELTGYIIRAFEDIDGGLVKSGHSIYGDCDDLLVRSWDTPFTDVLTIFLSN